MSIEDRLWLPCWSCTKPQAADCRVWSANASDEDFARQQSPGGLPLVCCRIHFAGTMPMPDAAPARTR
jgi:hypothetical protein